MRGVACILFAGILGPKEFYLHKVIKLFYKVTIAKIRVANPVKTEPRHLRNLYRPPYSSGLRKPTCPN